MSRFGLRCLVLVLLPLLFAAAALSLGCDDENKTVCCECVCKTIRGLDPPEEDFRTLYPMGTNLDCRAECQAQCSQIGWDLDTHRKISCDDTNADTSQ